MAGHGRAWQGMAGHGRAWQGMAGHTQAWQGMAGLTAERPRTSNKQWSQMLRFLRAANSDHKRRSSLEQLTVIPNIAIP
eukprot:366298-Chlamydomonas_euryale.AAC.4